MVEAQGMPLVQLSIERAMLSTLTQDARDKLSLQSLSAGAVHQQMQRALSLLGKIGKEYFGSLDSCLEPLFAECRPLMRSNWLVRPPRSAKVLYVGYGLL